MNLKQGTLLQGGRYRIEKVLGQGGFGITYLAEQTSLNDKVAIKEFFMKELCDRDSETMGVSVGSSGSRELVERFREKFVKEARNIRKLKHRNIVSIIDVFEENGTAYYVMEYLDGGNLKSLVDNRGPLAEATAVSYIRQVTDALGEVHANGMLHLDVKPANIMLDRRGNAVLIDFGISKHYDEGGSQTSSGLTGTSEGYAPLEQYEAASLKTFTPATDIYALGATLFFLLTGQRPPKASDVMNIGLPTLPSKASSCVRKAVEDAMNPVVRMRPKSVDAFLALLVASDSATPASADAETKITAEEATVIEPQVAEPLYVEPQSVALTAEKDANVKWIDFAQFCDYNGHSLKKMKAVSYMKLASYVVWSITLLFLTIYAICEMDGSKGSNPLWDEIGVVDYYRWEREREEYNEDTGKMEFVGWRVRYRCNGPGPVTGLFIGLSVLLLPVLIPIVKGERLNTLNLIDIQDTPLPLKLIRNNKGLLGLSLWNKKKSRSLLGMKYDNISRINDDTFVCTCNGLSGVYNVTKRKMVVPVKCESIEVKNNRIHATCDGVVTVYTDKGYRVVE